MTIIITDGKKIAADSLGLDAGGIRFVVPKLFTYPGVIVGVSGKAAGAREVAEWYALHGCDPERRPQIQNSEDWCRALALHKDGRVFVIENWGSFEVASRPVAAGSGHEIALTAMAMGADVEEAVRVACRVSVYCGLPVVSKCLDDIPDPAPILTPESP